MVAWGRLLAAHDATVTLKVVLCQRFGENVSNLVFCVDREYLDESLVWTHSRSFVPAVTGVAAGVTPSA